MSTLPDVLGASDEPKKSKSPLPTWVPVSLLAVTTAALALPLYLLKRHKAHHLCQLQKSAPPARRNVRAQAVVSRPTPTASVRRPIQYPQPKTSSGASEKAQAEFDDGFNAPLMGFKAFGIATLGVWTCAVGGVWGVKAYTGVQNIQEFGEYMRLTLLLKMPGLAARLHRSPDADPEPEPDLPTSTSIAAASLGAAQTSPLNETRTPWTWPEAENRLRTAFDERGFSGWAEAVLREVEAEARVERLKRGLESQQEAKHGLESEGRTR